MDKPSKKKFKVTLLNEDKKSAVPLGLKSQIQSWDKDDPMVQAFLDQCQLVKDQFTKVENRTPPVEDLNKLASYCVWLRDRPFKKELGLLAKYYFRSADFWPILFTNADLRWVRPDRLRMDKPTDQYMKTLTDQLGNDGFLKPTKCETVTEELIAIALQLLRAGVYSKEEDEPYEFGSTKSQIYWAKRVRNFLEELSANCRAENVTDLGWVELPKDKFADNSEYFRAVNFLESGLVWFRNLKDDLENGNLYLLGDTKYVFMEKVSWTSEMHRRNPHLFSIFYQSMHVSKGKIKNSPLPDFKDLKLSDKISDATIRDTIGRRIRMKLDGIQNK